MRLRHAGELPGEQEDTKLHVSASRPPLPVSSRAAQVTGSAAAP
jgi:hypothetical protein